MTPIRIAVPLVVLVALSACGAREPELLNLRSGGEPDEFAIVPNKPLEQPPSLSALPPPVPGAPNRTDQTPFADAAEALGGSRAAARNQTITDPGLVAYAGRYGTDPAIRDELAAADLDYRRRRDGRFLERLTGQNTYYRAYRPQSLDQYDALERARRAGLRTPAVPPPEATE